MRMTARISSQLLPLASPSRLASVRLCDSLSIHHMPSPVSFSSSITPHSFLSPPPLPPYLFAGCWHKGAFSVVGSAVQLLAQPACYPTPPSNSSSFISARNLMVGFWLSDGCLGR
ncbi:hypothetical protein CYLTODRAFT_52752 [Cylindrobasidium torrendii FP15055 ss-10]|uniref:Uncharacterized protein n=1 Tax=Cylindrobasidium torrendii FP15055 ss-10 TaxID=1314674 RepID=A0A0D7B8D4_9AGAR|nr:hypothetical protein CYLTODRAFT_52752 [Cylindrobasidium torrendii FP15055 ss-10]